MSDLGDDDAPAADAGAPAWMATFADLSTLLLTFFVLLLSFANMDVVKFREMMGSVQSAFGYRKENFGNFNPKELSAIDEDSEEEEAMSSSEGKFDAKKLMEELKSLIEQQELENSVDVKSSQRGVVIRVKDRMMFSSGKAKLSRNAPIFLNQVAQLMGKFPYSVLIEGHTDNRPMRSRRFPSNWELSTARATAVMRHLAKEGVSLDRMGVAGYGGTRPLASNKSEAGRVQNRRVEFICYRDVDLELVRDKKTGKETFRRKKAKMASDSEMAPEEAMGEGSANPAEQAP